MAIDLHQNDKGDLPYGNELQSKDQETAGAG